MKQLKQVRESDLHAYVDRQLSKNQILAVEKWLLCNPNDAEKVQDWKKANDLIVEKYKDIGSMRTPVKLRSFPVGNRKNKFQTLTASLLMMIISGLIGWLSHAVYIQKDWITGLVAQPALAAHKIYSVEKRHAVEVGADEEQHLVKWLSKRLDFPLRMPKLEHLDFQLIGGRLLSVESGPAAQFMFENSSANRITLFATQNKGPRESMFRFTSSGATNTFFWQDENIAYAIIGELDRDQLLKISKQVYAQLNQKSRAGRGEKL